MSTLAALSNIVDKRIMKIEIMYAGLDLFLCGVQ